MDNEDGKIEQSPDEEEGFIDNQNDPLV